jgi:hypothetical protein
VEEFKRHCPRTKTFRNLEVAEASDIVVGVVLRHIIVRRSFEPAFPIIEAYVVSHCGSRPHEGLGEVNRDSSYGLGVDELLSTWEALQFSQTLWKATSMLRADSRPGAAVLQDVDVVDLE